jgi:heptosyltransferase-2
MRLILAATMARVPIRAGIADNNLKSLYTHPFKYRDLPIHCAQRYAPLLGQLAGSEALHWEALTVDMLGGHGGIQKLKRAGWKGGPYVCLAFGTRGDAKRWLPERETWPVLANHLLKQGLNVVWLGSPGESALGQELCGLSAGSMDLTGQTSIPEAFAIIQSAYGTIAIDTGLAHLSAGAGRPTVTINSHSPEHLIQPIGPFSIMMSGPMLDLHPGQNRGTSVISPSMLRLAPGRVASMLHLLAAEATGVMLSPRDH